MNVHKNPDVPVKYHILKRNLKKIINASRISYFIAALIAIVLFYASFSKLYDFESSKREMLNQVFPKVIALQLAWLVPTIELIICGLLVSRTYRLVGLYAAMLLLSAFSIYISVTMTGIFGRIPCSCGGILKNMSYGIHLAFNLFLLLLIGIAITIERKMTGYEKLNVNQKGVSPKIE